MRDLTPTEKTLAVIAKVEALRDLDADAAAKQARALVLLREKLARQERSAALPPRWYNR